MKNFLQTMASIRTQCILLLLIICGTAAAQPATVSNPIGIARNCDNSQKDSVKVYDYDGTTNTLTTLTKCRPSLSTTFSASGGSVAFNPYDQNIYYITASGTTSRIWRWPAGTCPTGNLAAYKTYSGQFVIGMDFDPQSGIGYQVEFVGASAPYSIELRKVDFATNTFGTSYPVTLGSGTKIWKQSGDVVITPLGQMFVAFDNKLYSINHTDVGVNPLVAKYIDTLNIGAAGVDLVGLTYADGQFIGSMQGGGTCFYREININNAALTPITQPSSIISAFDFAGVTTGIGAAKNVFSISTSDLIHYVIKYDIKVKNFGSNDLTNVQATDAVASVFGAAFTSASIAAIGPVPSGITLNPLFNGNTNTNLFLGGATSTLNAGPNDSVTVRLTVNLTNPNINTTYNNSVVATATGVTFTKNVRDVSRNSPTLEPDGNNNDKPDDVSEDAPTPLLLKSWLLLPDRIVAFEAEKVGSRVNFNWSLGNETPGDKVIVEESFDGVKFSSIGTVACVGKGDNSYNFASTLPVNQNVVYYRIHLINPAGQNIYSGLHKMNLSQNTDPEIALGPVPFSDKLTMSMKLKSESPVTFIMTDQSMRIVARGTLQGHAGQNNFDIQNLAGLSTGIYILNIEVNKEHFVEKVIKH
jgi:uncharacterized repeat protein (TIGR01451 family)